MTVSNSAAILARRFGYGPAGPQPGDDAQTLAELDTPDEMRSRFPIYSRGKMMAITARYHTARQARPRDETAVMAGKLAMREMMDRNITAALARVASTRTPLRERLVWFWADHFTTRARRLTSRGLPSDLIDVAIRPNITAPFGTMLLAAETHPAMTDYLDQRRSVGPDSMAGIRNDKGVNENLAREIMELHTLGVGAPYTQKDVRQLALLLTGLVSDTNRPFRPSRAEPGAETVLGKSYGGGSPSFDDIRNVLEDLARNPATAHHLAHKLAVHFVADNPPADLVAALADRYRATDGHLGSVYEVLLTHPAAQTAEYEKARQPFEFIASAVRALGVDGDAVMAWPKQTVGRSLRRPLAVMGQPFMAPEGPNGWDEAAATWLTPQGIAARIVWGMKIPGQLRPDLPDPLTFVQTALGADAGPEITRAVARAPSQAEAIGLVLASPEFNTR